MNKKLSYHVNREMMTQEMREKVERDRIERRTRITRTKETLVEAKKKGVSILTAASH